MTHLFMNMNHAAMYTPRALHALHKVSVEDAEAFIAMWDDWGVCPLEYNVRNGVAIVDINGGLASAQIPLWFFYADTTYENVVETIRMAMTDDQVSAVALRFSSPGGTVMGCAEAAAQISKLSQGDKPVVAHANMADSAAYWLASATNRIYADPTGEVGSIGVIGWHSDYSKLYEEIGIQVTPIFSGQHKADGNPYAPLTDQAKQRMQSEMDFLRERFVEAVSEFRGMDFDAVKKTEAMTYIGKQGIAAGLADEVMFFDQLVETLPGLEHS